MDQKKTTNSKNQNLIAALTYFLGVITGVIFLLVERKNHYIRFHAMQSVLTFGGLFIVNLALGFISGLGFLRGLVSLAGLILWILLMVKAYQGETYKLPYIGDLAEAQLKKIG